MAAPTVNDFLGYRKPQLPDYGVTTIQLAGHQEYLSRLARLRLHGVGAEQYAFQTHQKFEEYTPQQLLDEARAELLDIINYVTMIDIQLERAVKKAKSGDQG